MSLHGHWLAMLFFLLRTVFPSWTKPHFFYWSIGYFHHLRWNGWLILFDHKLLCFLFTSKESHAHSLHRVLKRRNPPKKMATLQEDGNWNPSIWDDQSKRDICLFIHAAVSSPAMFVQRKKVISSQILDQIILFWKNSLMLSPWGPRYFTPNIWLWWNEEMITFLSARSAFIHVMTSKENVPHFGEKTHANNNIECVPV